jgi:hypothetical protein
MFYSFKYESCENIPNGKFLAHRAYQKDTHLHPIWRSLAQFGGALRRNPREYAGTDASGQEKTTPENGWGFIIDGG